MPESTVTINKETLDEVLVTVGAVSTFLARIANSDTDITLRLDEAWGNLLAATGDMSDERVEELSNRDAALADAWLLEAAHRGKRAPAHA